MHLHFLLWCLIYKFAKCEYNFDKMDLCFSNSNFYVNFME